MALSSTTVAVLTAASAAISAVGAIQQGKAARDQARTQAEIARQQADREKLVAQRDEEDFRRKQRAALAAVRAAGGARGVDISTGSPLLASEDFARETEVQARRIREGGDVRATRLEQQAELFKAKGRSAERGGFFGAGSALLSGGARTARILSED